MCDGSPGKLTHISIACLCGCKVGVDIAVVIELSNQPPGKFVQSSPNFVFRFRSYLAPTAGNLPSKSLGNWKLALK